MTTPPKTADGSINYPAVLDTAADIARAMAHLHRQQVRGVEGGGGWWRGGGLFSLGEALRMTDLNSA
jgi:hypothetical protein